MAPPKKTVNATIVKDMFTKYSAADDKVTAARAALDAAMAERTITVKTIVDTSGPGPYTFNGQTVKARKRDTKDDNGVVTGTTWFFYQIGGEIIDVG